MNGLSGRSPILAVLPFTVPAWNSKKTLLALYIPLTPTIQTPPNLEGIYRAFLFAEVVASQKVSHPQHALSIVGIERKW
jgi:hypothetical protein